MSNNIFLKLILIKKKWGFGVLGFVEAVVVAAVLFLTMLVNLGVRGGLLIASNIFRGSLELFQMDLLSWTVATTSSIKFWAMSTSRSITLGSNVGELGMGPAAPICLRLTYEVRLHLLVKSHCALEDFL